VSSVPTGEVQIVCDEHDLLFTSPHQDLVITLGPTVDRRPVDSLEPVVRKPTRSAGRQIHVDEQFSQPIQGNVDFLGAPCRVRERFSVLEQVREVLAPIRRTLHLCSRRPYIRMIEHGWDTNQRHGMAYHERADLSASGLTA